VTVSVDAVVYYRVSNATVSVANVENAHHSTRLLAQTTLRNMLGTRNLSEILSDREAIAASMQAILDEATDSWGIKVCHQFIIIKTNISTIHSQCYHITPVSKL
jgi:erythrocyte band 7 integral membrane protein